jgi:CRISPR-associated protein Csm4
MKTFHCVKLNFTSPLHLGRGIGETYDTGSKLLHSDTLSAALASARVQLFGDKNLKSYLESLRVSSAFPFYENHFFFPKPMLKLNLEIEGQDEHLQNKSLKKLEYLEQPLFEQVISGKLVEVPENRFSENKKYLWVDKPVVKNILKTDVQQRVTVPRDGQGDSVPYYVERLFFSEGAGLYFLMETENEQILRETEVALKYLEDTGLGTDRTVGNGFFNAEITNLQLAVPATSNHSMTLSLFCPAKEELAEVLNGDAAYLMEKRGGFIAGASAEQFRHLRKKSVFMFSEGAVFKGNTLTGKVLDLRPQWDDEKLHPVYRSGKPVFIPVVNQ